MSWSRSASLFGLLNVLVPVCAYLTLALIVRLAQGLRSTLRREWKSQSRCSLVMLLSEAGWDTGEPSFRLQQRAVLVPGYLAERPREERLPVLDDDLMMEVLVV